MRLPNQSTSVMRGSAFKAGSRPTGGVAPAGGGSASLAGRVRLSHFSWLDPLGLGCILNCVCVKAEGCPCCFSMPDFTFPGGVDVP